MEMPWSIKLEHLFCRIADFLCMHLDVCRTKGTPALRRNALPAVKKNGAKYNHSTASLVTSVIFVLIIF